MLAYWERRLEWMGEGLQLAICPSFTGPTSLQALDVSGRSNHGTLTSMDRNTAWQTSGGKGALGFDGVDDFVLSTGLGPATQSRSVSVWFRTSKVLVANTYGAMAGWGAGNVSQGFIVAMGNDTQFGNNGFGVTQWGDGVGTLGFNDGNWHSGTVVNTGTLWQVYVDGVFRTSKTMACTPTAKSVYLGRFEVSPFGYFDGQLDDIRIYDRALTPQEIWQLYERDRGGGMLYQPPKRRSVFIAAGFRAYWHRRQQQLIGGGLR